MIGRRSFLLGSLAALTLAAPAARILREPPLLRPNEVKRSWYPFMVLPHVGSPRELVLVWVYGDPECLMPQLEAGAFPTSYIPTGGQPGLRCGERLVNGQFSRPSRAALVHDGGTCEIFEPNKSRMTKHGLLLEEARTNQLRWTHPVNHHRHDQMVYLAPGEHILSWYGPGHMRLSGEVIALAKRTHSAGS